MFFLFGVRTTSRPLGQITYPCTKCGSDGFHQVAALKRRFTLFFVPVLPLGNMFHITCNRCGLRLKAVGDLERQFAAWQATGVFGPPPS